MQDETQALIYELQAQRNAASDALAMASANVTIARNDAQAALQRAQAAERELETVRTERDKLLAETLKTEA